ADDQAHIWLLPLSGPLEGDRHILDSEEQAQLDRFVVQGSREEFLASHVLMRRILGGYEHLPPYALAYTRNAYARPELHGASGLRFSLSHSGGWGALAVTRAGAVGVDVEPGKRALQTLGLAEAFFAPAEAAWLRQQPAERQPRDFLALWTLK